MRNIYSILLESLENNLRVALGIIISTRGSAPQIPGVSAVFSPQGLIAGTLGGGLLERDAQEKSFMAFQKKKPLLYDFHLLDDIASEEGAICGGSVKVLIDPMPENHLATFQRIAHDIRKRKSGVLATRIEKSDEDEISVSRSWARTREEFVREGKGYFSFLKEEFKRLVSDEKPQLINFKEKGFLEGKKENLLFLEIIKPFPQLVIAGAGHIGRALSHLGHLLDFEVTVVDDRKEYANRERLPDADQVIVDEIGKAIKDFPVNEDTYFVIVTRGHHYDAEALRACIRSEPAYIGMIGSRRKIKLMREKFIEEGWATDLQFDRVHAPIGIDINSKTVEEIAVSIAAELVLVRSQPRMKKREKKR
ncbi:MAG: XdhC family protein [Candidatus Aminicenantales bacterium]